MTRGLPWFAWAAGVTCLSFVVGLAAVVGWRDLIEIEVPK